MAGYGSPAPENQAYNPARQVGSDTYTAQTPNQAAPSTAPTSTGAGPSDSSGG